MTMVQLLKYMSSICCVVLKNYARVVGEGHDKNRAMLKAVLILIENHQKGMYIWKERYNHNFCKVRGGHKVKIIKLINDVYLVLTSGFSTLGPFAQW
jgi:hypothetical protein